MTDNPTTPEAAERARLKPCPFCGGEAFFPTINGQIADDMVWCKWCGAEMHGGEDGIPSAEENWNRRAALAVQEGGGERVTERWEPMETAPMDGTVIQFLQGGEVFAGFAGDDPDHPWQFLDRNGRQAFVNGFHHKFSPRWWRPLAEAPKEAALRAAQEGTGNG